MSGVERVRIDSETNLQNVLDMVHDIKTENVDGTHIFAISQVYEGLLLKMGEKGNDGGQFLTPRQIIKATVRIVRPQFGKTAYDPACGRPLWVEVVEYMRGGLAMQPPARNWSN